MDCSVICALHRVFHLLVEMGWVDLEFDFSTVCLTLPVQMEIWQKRLGNMVEHRNQSQPKFNHGLRADGLPK